MNYTRLIPWVAGLMLTGCISSAVGVELHGFVDYRYGMRTQSDPVENSTSLNEVRLQGDALWYHDLFSAQLKADLVYDEQAANRQDINLETGHGFLDLRQAYILTSPLAWMDLKVGRQTLTWGTGDLVFINDMFPKDWQSFFLGRDEEYLKAPSDALFVSMFPGPISIDVAYMPRFDADRYITGERLSYWNGQAIVGQNSIVHTDRPDNWFTDDEISARAYRYIGSYETAVYGYHGYWKSPGGMDPATGDMLFPPLNTYGASLRGSVLKGIGNLEAGYYDSVDDRDGSDPFVNNCEIRFLVGYEQEVARNLTLGAQYYLEYMLNHDAYINALESIGAATSTADDEARHTLTLRITWMLLNQNLVLSAFTRYSPSDQDLYMRPAATYKLSDRWQLSLGGNLFSGRHDYTFLGQFEENSNVDASLRYSF